MSIQRNGLKSNALIRSFQGNYIWNSVASEITAPSARTKNGLESKAEFSEFAEPGFLGWFVPVLSREVGQSKTKRILGESHCHFFAHLKMRLR
jgi:hypothetical protein